MSVDQRVSTRPDVMNLRACFSTHHSYSGDHHDVMSPPLPLPPYSLSLSPPSCLNWPCRWNEINSMSHNRSFFALELANREESVQFQTVSLRRRIAASQLSPNRRPLSRSASLINSSGIRQPASTKHLCLLRAWVGLLLALLGYVTYACLLKWHAVRCSSV